MGFLHPALLLLALPVAVALWRTRSASRPTTIVRALVATLLVLALAAPYTVRPDEGRDLVVLVDRSRSMPPEATNSALEVIALAEQERGPGDRVHVVAFGADAAIEHVDTTGEARFAGFERTLDEDGSDLGEALELGLGLLGADRPGALLLLSDGEGNGRDPLSIARRAYGRGARVDVRDFQRPAVADLLVERIDLPEEVAVGEPFQFNVWVRSERRVETSFELRRGGQILSSGPRVFEPGLNRVVLRDRLTEAGVSEYEVRLGSADDRIPENNRGLGAVRATGAAAVLVLNHDGAEDTLVRALRRAGIPVAVTTPEGARLDAVGLSGFRAVILENVAATRLGQGLGALREHVLDRGAGLLVTGGQASFGVGGYHHSAIDEILPVSMELRQEHRKFSVAMAIAMDRSGSMSVRVPGGLTKMDLANNGASAAIALLAPVDDVSVIAVDSAAHVIVPMRPVGNGVEAQKQVRGIRSMGGGIFVWEALQACLEELSRSKQANQHIILFSDASDSEQFGPSITKIQELHASRGLTLSVIALGNEQDQHAIPLRELAEAGGGEIYFSVDPNELPRLFAMDTMKVSRSTFVNDPTAVDVLPDLFGVGPVSAQEFPGLEGYNLTYLRPEATAGMVTLDEYAAPVFAFSYQGLGRTAAYTGQIGGRTGQGLVAWDGFADFFVTTSRWLLGQEEPEEFFASVRREGRDAVLTVEVDPDAPTPPDTSELEAVLSGAGGARSQVALQRVDEHTYEARVPLERSGVTLGTVRLGGDRFVTLPPIVLPYSPEFERRPDTQAGARLLRRIARESGGVVGATAGSFFRGERTGRLWRVVSFELMLCALVLLLVEIAARRLSLWGSLRWPAGLGAQVARAARALRARVPRRSPARPKPSSSPASPEAPAKAATPAPDPTLEPGSAPDPEPAGPEPSMGSALSRARRAADRKLDR